MDFENAKAGVLAIMVAVFGLAALPAGAGAYAKRCSHVRGYNQGRLRCEL
jgi:hypothetical protein